MVDWEGRKGRGDGGEGYVTSRQLHQKRVGGERKMWKGKIVEVRSVRSQALAG